MNNVTIEFNGSKFSCNLNNMAFYLANMWGDLQCNESIRVILPMTISLEDKSLKDEMLKFYKYCNDLDVDVDSNGISFDIKKINLKTLATKYLKDLGLKIKDIKGKRVLDIGSGAFTWSKYMPQEYIINLEKDPERCIDRNHICADTTQPLPFPDASFDIIISRCCAPIMWMGDWNSVGFKKLLDSFLNEVLRCLKTGGIARLGPVQIEPNTIAREKYLLDLYYAHMSESNPDWLTETEFCRQVLRDTIYSLKGVDVSVGECYPSETGCDSYIAIIKK